MPRARKTAEVEETVEAEEPKPRRARRAKAAPKTEEPTRRGRRAKAAAEPEPATDEPKKRGRPRSAEPTDATAWQSVTVEDNDAVTVGEKAPRGKHQTAIVEFIESRGRKKTTVGMIASDLEEAEVPSGYANYVIRNAIYRDVLAVS
jgi:hypothetical protein